MRKLLILFFLISATTTFAQSWGQGAIRILAGTGITVSFNNGDYTLSSTAVAPAGSVDSTSIVDLSVAATDLVNLSVLNGKIANSAVDSNKVKASNITSTDIKDAEVLNADIANGSITVNKFASTVYPAIRGKVGWTSNGTITSDTVTTRIEWGGTPNTTHKIFDADNDSINFVPQNLNVVQIKDGSTVLAVIDSTGKIVSGGQAAGNGTIALDGSGAQPALKVQASDGDLTQISTNTSDQMAFTGASGNYTFDNWLSKPDMLEFLGGALKETPTTGASDTTANYMPLKAFSVGDTATFDFSTGTRFTTLDSIVVLAYSNTATSSVVFNCQIRQVQIGGAIAGAFNASSSKTIATGTAGTLRQWSFTSFGSVTASVYSQIVGKIFRTAGGTGGDVFVTRVLLYGVGLR